MIEGRPQEFFITSGKKKIMAREKKKPTETLGRQHIFMEKKCLEAARSRFEF